MEDKLLIRRHPLAYHDSCDNEEDESRLTLDCSGCRNKIFGPFYKCTTCTDIHLHKFCAEIPRQLDSNHTMHPDHHLTLSDIDFTVKCSACEDVFYGSTYRCHSEGCEFYLDPICAMLSQKVELEFHKHPLISMLRPDLLSCDACGVQHEGGFYHCAICEFRMNLDCVSKWSQKTILTTAHPHLLLLSSSPPEYTIFSSSCFICSRAITRRHWFYFCAACRYVCHVSCALSEAKAYRDHPINDDFGFTAINFPLTNEFVDQVIHMNKNINQKPTQIYHISHHHPLYFADVPIDDESYSSKRACLCDTCKKPVLLNPSLSCNECNFFLHESCAKLPFELKYRGHREHPLILCRWQSNYSNLPKCEYCKSYCTSISFGCFTCNFFLDIECAIIEGTFVHDSHEHPLVAYSSVSNMIRCHACGDPLPTFYLNCTQDCDFKLHLRCCFTPSIIAPFSYDNHLLRLNYSGNSSNECSCKLCGKQLTEMNGWFYHSDDSDLSLHMNCSHSSLFVIKHKAHVHTLTLDLTVKFKCAACNFSEDKFCNVAFICFTCDFKVHIQCAFLPNTVVHRYDEHPYTLTYYGNEEEYYCGICEEEIDSRLIWFYHCDTCGQSLHTVCALLDEDECANIKINPRISGKSYG